MGERIYNGPTQTLIKKLWVGHMISRVGVLDMEG
jgi:hypothetical protein